jgi:hypothetical protein
MTDISEILHRIEHKLDIVLEKMNLSSMAETASSTKEREDLLAQVHAAPSLPQNPRICPICIEPVKMIPAAINIPPHVSYDKNGMHVQGFYRQCGCKITPLTGVI